MTIQQPDNQKQGFVQKAVIAGATLAVAAGGVLYATSAPTEPSGKAWTLVYKTSAALPTFKSATYSQDVPLSSVKAQYPGAEVYQDFGAFSQGFSSPVPSDPLLNQEWALTEQYGANAISTNGSASVWQNYTGKGVTIAVLDSGIRQESKEFKGRLLPGYDFVSDAVRAADGDGVDNSPLDPGGCTISQSLFLQYASASNPLWGSYGSNAGFHGTHTAGIAAAGGNDGVGMIGVAPEAKVLPVRVMGSCGSGVSADIANGIIWAAGGAIAGVPRNPYPAKIISMSLGGLRKVIDDTTGTYCDSTYQIAIDYAYSKGAVVVASAGNNGIDAARNVPAGCDHVVTVTASYSGKQRAAYSAWGDVVEISAPGGCKAKYGAKYCPNTLGAMLSVVDAAANVSASDGQGTMGNGAIGKPAWIAYNGTSMAAPMVAGALALYFEKYPTATYEQAVAAMQATSSDFSTVDIYTGNCRRVLPSTNPVLTGYNAKMPQFVKCGAGLLNIRNLLAN